MIDESMYIGMRYGKIVIEKFVRKHNGHRIVLCRCDCGNTKEMILGNVKKHNTCGCEKGSYKHGYAIIGSKYYGIYGTYRCMHSRCYNRNEKKYPHYGGRGIKISNHWLNIDNFIADMYDSYIAHCNEFGKHNTTIERVDNNGDYCKENCVWKTRQEQNRNTSRNIYPITNKE